MMAKGPFSSVLQSSLSSIDFGKQANWFVTHVDGGSGLFYLQQNEPSISVKYERQMQDIETAVSQGRLESFIGTPPQVGSLCIAQYSEDGQWYRGQVLGFVEDDSEIVEVVFIDYGNGENLSWKCLKKAPKEFSELPAQAIQCKLANIQPVGGIWGKEGIKLLKELILERELVGKATHLCKSGAVLVVLYADEDKSALVAEQLVMAGFAYWKKVKSSLSQSSSSSSSSASIAAFVNAKPGQLGTLKIKVGSRFDLFISHINSLDSFYCQPVENSKSLDETAKEMQVFYNSDRAVSELKLTAIRVNQVCCARYSADAAWYRAVVKKVSLGQNYEVQFVDFGNSELLPSSEIRDLTSTFKQLPISSVHCFLHGTRPRDGKSSFDDDAIQKFEDLTFEKQLVGYVSQVDEAGKLAIVLYDKKDSNNEININKELAKLSNVVFDEDVKYSPIKSDSSQSIKGATIPHLVSMQLNEGDCEVGYVAFSQSPFDFSCQLSKSAASLENMMQELNDEYLALKPGENKLQLIETGVPCCARYSGDGRFYRTELKKIMGTNALIYFVDYGNDEQCRLDEVKYLRKEYLKLPKQAFKCRLAGIEKPPGNDFPSDVSAQFNDMVMDKEFSIHFGRIDSQSICEVSLVENNDRNVVTFDAAKVLIDSGMVNPLRVLNKDDLGSVTTTEQFCDIEIPKEEFIDVMPTHVANPNEFCCQLLENSEKIDALMADLETAYKGSNPSRNLKLKNGMPCVALYPVDENWYRGLVVHVKGREADVNYVDFGNTETLNVDRIRLIYSKFMKLPAQAVVCSLVDIIPKGEGDWSEDAISLFSELTLEKQLIACFKMKDESNLHHVELLDTQTNRKQQTDIADIFFEKGFAKQKKRSSNSQTNGHQESSSTEQNKFSKMNLRVKAEETVYISHIDDVENFYCQLTSQEDSLYELLEKVNLESEKLPPVTSLVKGKLVCALFSADNSWYRGEVTKVIDSGNAIVKFVDYGNSGTNMMSSMREISSALLDKPEYAIHCSLCDGGMKWKEDALKELIKVTADKVLKMTVKEIRDKKYIIDLFDENNVSIGSKLVDSAQPLPQNMLRQSTGKEQSAGKEQMTIKHPVVENIEVKPGTKMECFISYIESLTEFYVQQCSASKDLDFVSEELVKASSFAGLSNPKKGEICCANYESDNLWYRAEIIQVNGSEAETFFFDYGNSDFVNIGRLKSLPRVLHKTPRLSIACALHGVTSKSDDHIDTFCNMTVDKTVSVEFVRKNADGRYDVKLRVKGELITFEKGRKDPHLMVDVKETASKEESDVLAAATCSSSTAQSPAVIIEFNDKLLQVGDKEKVFVCYVVTAQEFYCQLSREINMLNSMMDKLEEYYGNEPPGQGSLSSLVPGVPCAAKYSVDRCWYRASLEGLQDPSHAKVNFVDYGNAETVEVKDLKKLEEEFLEHPTFAFKCSLPGYAESASEFENEVMDREVELNVIGLSGSTYIVDLVGEDGRSLGSRTKISMGSAEKTAQCLLRSFKKAEIVEEGSTIDVYYLDGKSPQDFYCHIAKYESEFETLTKEIAQKGITSGSLDALKIEAPCLALFSEDRCWYRGKVLEPGKDKSKVEFVDYGNEEWVDNVHIKSIADELLTLPVQAVRCCLANVRPASSTWTAAERGLFQGRCDEKLLSATIKSFGSDKFNVILMDTQTGENINEIFNSCLNGKSEDIDRVDDKPRFKNAEVSKGMMLEVLCTFVKGDGILSCQLIKYEKELSKLMRDISLYCNEDAEKASHFEVDLACFALYNVDNGWYRAKVVKSDGNNVTVRFVDYGNEAVCPKENLRKLRPKDLELPATCIDCNISGIVVDNDVVDVIEQNCLEEELIVNIKDVINAELVLADVVTMESKLSVCDIVNKKISSSDARICEMQNSDAERILTYEKVTLEVGASKDVICTNVTSFNAVSCQVLGYEDKFDGMMEKIALHCEEHQNVVKNAVKGQSCLGRYLVDDGWYRAEVLDVSSDRMRLRYVDYGNEDDVPLTDTREMANEFMELPALSISCKLHAVDRENLDFIKAKDWLESSCLNDVFKAYIIAAGDDGTYEVNLRFCDSNKSINEALVTDFALQEDTVEAKGANCEAMFVAPDEKPDVIDKASSLDEAAPSQNSIEELQYTELQFKSSDRLRAICSYVDDDVKIYCQPTEYSSNLEQLMTDIANYCAEKDRTIVTLKVGVPCFALYSEDGAWYRAEVVEVVGEMVKVIYVDYGNCSLVKRNDVLPMTEPFLKLAKSCFACILQGSFGSLSLADVKVWVEENLIGEELEIEIIANHHGDCYLAALCWQSKNVESLLKQEFQDCSKEDGAASNEVENDEIKKFTWELVSFPSSEIAICTHVESLHEVFVQRAKYHEKFDDLFEKIQTYCNGKGSIPKEFKKGSSCLAKYSEDEQWYRAEVMESMKESVKVRFVDYGNTDIVLFENTRALSDEFVSLPATSMKCHLYDVHEKDIDIPDAVRWLKENVVEQEVDMEIVNAFDDCYECILRKSGDDETVNDQLYYLFELAVEDHSEAVDTDSAIKEGARVVEKTRTEIEATAVEVETNVNETEPHVDKEETQATESEPQSGECEEQGKAQTNESGEQGSEFEQASTIVESIEKDNADNVDDFYVGKLSQQAPKLGAKECVVCTHVESLNCISIQLLEFQERFRRISKKISDFCQESKTLPEKIDVGLGCLAMSEDEDWYRAEVISVSSENVDVRFVDYGNTETVLKQNTRAITKDFASLPAMSVSCQLHDVHDSDIDVKKAEDWLHENLVEHDIDVEIIGKIDDTYDVIITRKNESVSVNDLLYKEFELQEESLSVLEDNGVTAAEGNSNTADSAHTKLDPNTSEFSPLAEASLTSNPREIQLNPREIQSRKIDFGSTVKMHLSFQVSPSMFWCQFDDSGDELLKMMEELEASYDGENVLPFSAIPTVGAICCAQFSEDCKWYRGEVCEIYDNSNCMIHFIDYGNAERVELSGMKELKPQYFDLEKQAIKCSLDGVRPIDGEWSEEATFEFEELCADKILDVEILSEGEALNVIVKTGDCDVTVNTIMIEKGFGVVDVASETH